MLKTSGTMFQKNIARAAAVIGNAYRNEKATNMVSSCLKKRLSCIVQRLIDVGDVIGSYSL
jgi:glucose-6-phosphate isomerase